MNLLQIFYLLHLRQIQEKYSLKFSHRAGTLEMKTDKAGLIAFN